MAKTYSEKLKDPRWQKKRLHIMERDKFTCQNCDGTKETLNVHHKNYYYGKDPWDCSDSNLITLCQSCHEIEEDWKQKTKDIMHDLLLMGWDYHRIYHSIEYGLFKDDPKLWHKFLKEKNNG